MTSKRLMKLYTENTNKQNGLEWYTRANKFALQLSVKYNTPLEAVCSVIAIISPAVTWEVNKRDAKALIRAHSLQNDVNNVIISTYKQNKLKAISILKGKEVFVKTKTNYKTYSFFRNILNPLNNNYVTIDRHAIKALKGIKKGGSVYITPKKYKLAEKAYKCLALELNITPCQAQAVIWEQYKISVGR